jgi:hypothetical protein
MSYGEKQLAASAANAHVIGFTKQAIVTLDRLPLSVEQQHTIGKKLPLSVSTNSFALTFKPPPAVNPLPQNQSVRHISNPSLLTKEKTVEAEATTLKLQAAQPQAEKQQDQQQQPKAQEQEKELKE